MTAGRQASWCWIALLDELSPKADAAAPAFSEDGSAVGMLTVWLGQAKPVRQARRADVRIFDPDGAPAVVSLVLAPPKMRLLFDDLAVQQARREILAGPAPALVSTLLSDASHFEGAISAWRGAATWQAHSDPFARICPAQVLHVGPGVLGQTPPLAGPTIERYGSARPWPWDRFADA